MAASRVIGIPELLGLIAYQSNNHQTLYNACLVNHAFNDVFTPYLYRNMRWNSGNVAYLIDNERRRWLLEEHKAKHVRVLIMTNPVQYPDREKHYGDRVHLDNRTRRRLHQISTAIIELSQHFHQLRAFACDMLALTPQCLRALSRLPHLESCSIHFPALTRCNRDFKTFGSPWEEFAFANLRKLAVLGISDGIEDWSACILQVALRSPHLENLSLSILESIPFRTDYLEFFSWIAEQYNNNSGHKLRLKTLRLGRNILIPQNIDNLLDLQALQEISVYQDFYNDSWELISPSLPACLFQPDLVPNLRKIFVATLDSNGYRAIQELAAASPVPLSLGFGSLDLREEEDSRPAYYQKCWQRLRDLRVSQLIVPQCSPIGIRYDDRGPRHEEGFSQVRKLTHITDLALEITPFDPRHFVESNSHKPLTSLKSLWVMGAGDGSPSDLAKQCANALPALRFVRFGYKAYHIHRKHDSEGGIDVEPLDEWEEAVDRPGFFNVPLPFWEPRYYGQQAADL
ncbi:hypothetical protein F4803DRAFT_377737 [Xylaria telfairii]|nr:hypothetical protein F4803DRAFT_377737 [Xylaria telfairii]